MDGHYFPTFDECPHENFPDMSFFTLRSGYMFTPKRHWCLLAEITDVEYFVRLRLCAKDRSGKEFPIAFYIEDNARCIDFNRFQKGRTVAILCAEQHGFLDMTTGIRQESTSTIEVFDMPLDGIVMLSEKIRKQTCANTGSPRCDACGAESESILMCARCRCTWYCNSTCQKQGWKQGGHQKDCRQMRDIKKLVSFGWGDISKDALFPL